MAPETEQGTSFLPVLEERVKQIPHTKDTDSTCADNNIVSKKLNKTFGSNLEHLPVFKAISGADPEQNAGMNHEYNPENLLVSKALRGDDPQVQSRKSPCF